VIGQPQGDSFGSLSEQVLERRLVVGKNRSLRERQLALLVMCAGALAIVIDTSVVNVALPSIAADLGFSPSGLSWVVNAYVIPFGGLLLFAGRLGDLIGPKRLFVGGLGLFTLASLACGLAQDPTWLVTARFLQGIGGALAAAVVLSMVVALFPKPGEQAKAIGVYTFVSSAGSAVGLVVGAILTEALNWHWIFFVNVPLGLVTVLLGRWLLDDEREEGRENSVDLPGAALITATLMLAVYTIINASDPATTWVRTVVLTAVCLALLVGFVVRQLTAVNPLVPLSIFRARNVAWANVVQALMIAGVGGMFFLGALYLRSVLRLSPMQTGLAFLPTALAVAFISLEATPKLLDKVDARTILLPGLLVLVVGLLLLARVPTDGNYLVDVLPAMAIVGVGAGFAYPSALTVIMADATTGDRGLRAGLANTTQQIGPAIGLAVLAAAANARTGALLSERHAPADALTGGYRLAFLLGAAFVAAAALATLFRVRPAVPRTVPNALDRAAEDIGGLRRDLTGAADPDFLALGLGGTNMMAMLWTVALGRRAVGVELRGSPYVSVMRWTVREDLYHHLVEIDRLMAERFGEDRLPKRGDGRCYRLAECFYTPYTTAGSVRGDEVVTAFEGDSHIGGVARHHEFIDDRWVDGRPNRTITRIEKSPPGEPLLGRDMATVLATPAAFQVGAEELLIVLRRYLEDLEQLDLRGCYEPRVRLFPYHRVPHGEWGRRSWRGSRRHRARPDEDGFSIDPDGQIRIRIEAVRELDYKGAFRRVRVPNTEVVDLGVPKLFMIAENRDGVDAERLGFVPEPVTIDHGDGRGPVPAEVDILASNVDVYFDQRIRRRSGSTFDRQGNEYWVRNISIGHEEDAQIGWTLFEVPAFMAFDPVTAGLVPPRTDLTSKEFFAGHQFLLRKFFLDQLALMTEIPRIVLDANQLSYGPKLFTIKETIGRDALVAPNGVVGGDSFGTGHYIDSGGVNVGLIGHAYEVLRYWQAVDAGTDQAVAIRALADGIKACTQAWNDASEPEFAQPKSKLQGAARAAWYAMLAEATRYRRSIVPQNYPDEWSRILLKTGKIYTYDIPPLQETPPEERGDRRTRPTPPAEAPVLVARS